MDDNKLISLLAAWIAKQYPTKLILMECADLIGEESSLADDFYDIEDAPQDKFCGMTEWWMQITLSLEVSTHYEGGYLGCDLSECDCVIDDVIGIEDCVVKYVGYTDENNCDIEFTEHEKEMLEEELLRLWRK